MSLFGKRAVVVMAVAILFLSSPLSFAEIVMDDAGNQYISDQMIIGIAKECPKLAFGEFSIAGYSTGVQSLDKLCQRYGITKVQPWFTGKLRDGMHLKDIVERMYIFTTDGRYNIREVTVAFSQDFHLEYAELYDVPIPYYTPNDPMINQQWFLARINAYEAWDLLRGDATKAAIVGISDTGVYYDHPDLESNMWINEPEDINHNWVFDNFPANQGGDINHVDDDGNGYEDDVVGYDLGVGDPDPSEDLPLHGTHVAGCASEATNNGLGGAGIGFSARIIAAKGANINGSLTAVYQAIVYSVANGANVCNCSWGSYYYNQAYQNIITNAFNDGCLMVASAGNDNSSDIVYPAGYENCMAVAATGQNDVRPAFSNYGEWIDISAPGFSIKSTWFHDEYINLNGTSASSPIVCGTACLIKAQKISRQPQEIWDILINSSDSAALYTANPGWEGLLGSGRVDAYAALVYGLPASIHMIPEHPPIHVPAGGTFVYTGILVNQTPLLMITDIWIKVKMPDSQYTGVILTVSDFQAQPWSINHFYSIHQAIPDNAPAGEYFYIAYRGDFPVACDSAALEITITDTAEDTESIEEWMVAGWGNKTEPINSLSKFELLDNYPDPFNVHTTIAYNLPHAIDVTLGVYNLMGQKVATLAEGRNDAGAHSVTWDASNFASGIYFYKITTGEGVLTKQMTLLK